MRVLVTPTNLDLIVAIHAGPPSWPGAPSRSPSGARASLDTPAYRRQACPGTAVPCVSIRPRAVWACAS